MKDLLINEEIRDKEVRLVGTDGEQLGIVSISVAQNMAIEKNMDLVKIAPQAVPPVCKIMDYGKFKFEQAKREKEAKKNQKVIEIKEVRLSLNIDTNDFNTKVNRAIKFLEAGDKVKAALRFRGREMAHPELGVNIMQRFTDAVEQFTMPKLKTHSGAKKRFKLTKNGKVKRAHAYKSHILTKKDTKRGRRLRQGTYADKTNAATIKLLIPYK